jgi:aminobenzoyl-glutamate utilization protein A
MFSTASAFHYSITPALQYSIPMQEILPHIEHDDELDFLITLRRAFHQYPEVGFTEFWTTSKICELLSDWGYELFYGKALYTEDSLKRIRGIVAEKIRDNAYALAQKKLHDHQWLDHLKGGCTGVIAHLKGTQPGPKIGFRFDIDGLPIQESTDPTHIPFEQGFISTNSNMHACGHDGHITIGLGLAKRLCEHQRALKGDVYLIFQPAEETPLGGSVFSQLDIIQQLDYVIPVHVGLINQRKIVCGLSFLASQQCEVRFIGSGSHAGGAPEKGRNALLAACHAVCALYGIARHSEGISRINVGQFISDNATNVISDTAEFAIDIRGESNEIARYLAEQAEKIVQGAARMYSVNGHFQQRSETITVSNSPAMMDLAETAALKAGVPQDAILKEHFVPVSEDATYLMQAVRNSGGLSSYLCVGSPTVGGHHNSRFDFDEDILL